MSELQKLLKRTALNHELKLYQEAALAALPGVVASDPSATAARIARRTFDIAGAIVLECLARHASDPAKARAVAHKAYNGHDCYVTGDESAPDVIKDENGEVVLDLCKKCGRGEIELDEPCTGERNA